MSIVNTLSLKSNRQIKINFDGGDRYCSKVCISHCKK